MKLGKTQRLVLENVRDGRQPYHGHRTFAEYTRRETVAHELAQRGWLKLLPFGHPSVRLREGERFANPWRLTPLGKTVLLAGTP